MSTAALTGFPRSATAKSARYEPRWTPAFLGILAYLLIEYTRLAAMFPPLQPLQLGKVAVALAALGLLISPRLQRAEGSVVRWIDWALVAFVSISLASTLLARDSEMAWLTFLDTLRWVFIYFLISRIVQGSWRTRAFAFLLLLLNLKLGQFVVRSYFFSLAYGRSETFLSERGVGAGSTGFFGNPGDLGVAMCVVLPLAASLLFAKTGKWFRLLLLACLPVFLAAILMCGSRGAVVGAAAVVAASVVWHPRKIASVVAIVALLASLALLPQANWERLKSASMPEADKTVSIRFRLWRAAASMFLDNPVLGIGPGNFRYVYIADYADEEAKPFAWAPHSIYFQALSELGALGILTLGGLWIAFFRMNARSRKALLASGMEPRSFEYCLAVGLDLAMIGLMTSGAFLTVLYYPHLWILLGMGAGLNATCCRKRAESSAPQQREVSKAHLDWRQAVAAH